jgi:hypothetical protein
MASGEKGFLGDGLFLITFWIFAVFFLTSARRLLYKKGFGNGRDGCMSDVWL